MGSALAKQTPKTAEHSKRKPSGKGKENKVAKNRNLNSRESRAKTKMACDAVRKLQKRLPLPANQKAVDKCRELGV